MELIEHYYQNKINNIPIYYLKEQLNNFENNNTGLPIIKCNGKLCILTCVRDYYLDPKLNSKIKKLNISNQCPQIQNRLGIENVTSKDCKNCHLKAIEEYLKNNIHLIKKGK
jgi:hypothetical protein